MSGPTTFFSELDEITQILEKRRFADVFRFISFLPFETYGPHQHVRIEINFVKKGSCTIHLDHESISFKENEMMIICSLVEHTFEAGPKGTTLLQLEFLPDVFAILGSTEQHFSDLLSTISFFAEENGIIKIVNNLPVLRLVERIVDELHTKSRYFQHLVVMYYAELLVLLYRDIDEVCLVNDNNKTLKSAVDLIRRNFHSDIQVSEIAGQLEVSERYLRTLFMKYLRVSPIEYLNQIRINKAVELFRNDNLSVKEVCYRCGFHSPQYFSRAFKKQMGFSPKEITR